MTEVTGYAPGTFCWIDLGTTDPAAAKEFYSRLFGWSAEEVPAERAGTHTRFRMNGKDVCAVYEMRAEQQSRGASPCWTSYVSVTDAEERAELASGTGGTVLVPPVDVKDEGRMAVVQDPTGAVFSLWEPKAHYGAQVVNEPGGLVWNELATDDPNTASAFYTKLFGWRAETEGMGPVTYTTFNNGNTAAAGMLEMTEEWQGLPSHWMVYFAVADCDDTAAKAEELGAEIRVPPRDVPIGRFSVIRDPQGAVFSILETSSPA